jgi:hypothetical protein
MTATIYCKWNVCGYVGECDVGGTRYATTRTHFSARAAGDEVVEQIRRAVGGKPTLTRTSQMTYDVTIKEDKA